MILTGRSCIGIGILPVRPSAVQVASLDAVQQAGQLGCFGLTEKLAGVNSGMVVGATATCRCARCRGVLLTLYSAPLNDAPLYIAHH